MKSDWDTIHKKSINIQTYYDHVNFCNWIRYIGTTLSCGKCRSHFIDFCLKSPPENCTNLFNWTVQYHNDVNKLLDKPLIDYSTARLKYS